MLQAEDTACAKAQRPQRAWQYTSDRTCRISSLEALIEEADTAVYLDVGFAVAASVGYPSSSLLPLLL